MTKNPLDELHSRVIEIESRSKRFNQTKNADMIRDPNNRLKYLLEGTQEQLDLRINLYEQYVKKAIDYLQNEKKELDFKCDQLQAKHKHEMDELESQLNKQIGERDSKIELLENKLKEMELQQSNTSIGGLSTQDSYSKDELIQSLLKEKTNTISSMAKLKEENEHLNHELINSSKHSSPILESALEKMEEKIGVKFSQIIQSINVNTQELRNLKIALNSREEDSKFNIIGNLKTHYEDIIQSFQLKEKDLKNRIEEERILKQQTIKSIQQENSDRICSLENEIEALCLKLKASEEAIKILLEKIEDDEKLLNLKGKLLQLDEEMVTSLTKLLDKD